MYQRFRQPSDSRYSFTRRVLFIRTDEEKAWGTERIDVFASVTRRVRTTLFWGGGGFDGALSRGNRQFTHWAFVVDVIAILSENPISVDGVLVTTLSAEERRLPTRGLAGGKLRYVHTSCSTPDTDNPEGPLNN